MDMLGDAEPVDLTDDAWDDDVFVDGVESASPPRMTPEAWAVTSLTLSVASLFIVGLAQYAVFLLTTQFIGGDGQNARTRQFLLAVGPTGAVALGGAYAGWVAWRRRAELDPWAVAVATAGLVLGALLAALVVAGTVVSATVEPGTLGGQG